MPLVIPLMISASYRWRRVTNHRYPMTTGETPRLPLWLRPWSSPALWRASSADLWRSGDAKTFDVGTSVNRRVMNNQLKNPNAYHQNGLPGPWSPSSVARFRRMGDVANAKHLLPLVFPQVEQVFYPEANALWECLGSTGTGGWINGLNDKWSMINMR